MNTQKFLYSLLVLQFVFLLLNPPSIFKPTSQQWWLPALLVLMALWATVQIFRRTVAPWTLHLLSFSHGFNIISRLLMLLPQSTSSSSFDTLYFILSIIAMLFSAFMLWLLERPQTRQILS
ncbi:MAG: hypothetical protein N2049_08675 [Anaerolineales bacterium]|nr:hypothetical protein [Anaerolineales bacterium]